MKRSNGLDEFASRLRHARTRARRTGVQVLQTELRMAECFLDLATTTANDRARRRTLQDAARTVGVVRDLAGRLTSPVQRNPLLERCDRLSRRLAKAGNLPVAATTEPPLVAAAAQQGGLGLELDGRTGGTGPRPTTGGANHSN
jgi:hypothetical protein